MITLVVLYFVTPKEKTDFRKRLGVAGLLQLTVLALTFYIVTQINLKLYFSDIEKYADVIPGKVLLINILSVVRLALGAIALISFSGRICRLKKNSNC